MDEVIIPPTTGRVGLRLFNLEREPAGAVTYFSAEIFDPSVRATARIYAWGSEHMPDVFDSMAAEWRGWTGTKEWKSVEGDLKLAFKADGKGHVDVEVELRGSYYPVGWSVQATALIEAGQLELLARSVRDFLGANHDAA